MKESALFCFSLIRNMHMHAMALLVKEMLDESDNPCVAEN